MITCVWGIYWEKSGRDGVGGQHQWGMTPRPIKQFIWVVSGDVRTCHTRRGGEERRRMKKRRKRIKTAIEINGQGIQKPQKITSLSKVTILRKLISNYPGLWTC
jgi:hypothetical protein